jgi:hypothetical protein
MEEKKKKDHRDGDGRNKEGPARKSKKSHR